MKRKYFEFLELLDEETYGTFFKEPLESPEGMALWRTGARA